MRDLPQPGLDTTLYGALATPVAPGVAAGETRRSAGKETVDADHESDLAVLLLDRN